MGMSRVNIETEIDLVRETLTGSKKLFLFFKAAFRRFAFGHSRKSNFDLRL
jgi:hypothetical protein